MRSFWFLFGLSIVLLAAATRAIPTAPRGAHVPVDFAGAALIASGLAALLLAISKGNDWGWTSGRSSGLFAGSAALLAAFVLVERSVRHPLVDLAFVGRPPFANAIVCAFAVGYAFAVAVIVVPPLAALPTVTGYGLGYSTTQHGAAAGADGGHEHRRGVGRRASRRRRRATRADGRRIRSGRCGLRVTDHRARDGSSDRGRDRRAGSRGRVDGDGHPLPGRAQPDARQDERRNRRQRRDTHHGSAVGAAASAAILTGAIATGPVPAESGFTDCFLMGAVASGAGVLASVLLPGRPDRAS